jgi:hypothetical protein
MEHSKRSSPERLSRTVFLWTVVYAFAFCATVYATIAH